jgi:hypothetical protein
MPGTTSGIAAVDDATVPQQCHCHIGKDRLNTQGVLTGNGILAMIMGKLGWMEELLLGRGRRREKTGYKARY